MRSCVSAYVHLHCEESDVWRMHMHICMNLCTCACERGRLEIKTLCGTQLMIGLELKQKAEEHTEERRKKRVEGVSDCLHCGHTACVWAVSYQNVRRTFPH